jgi:hypothetical protein
MSPDLAELECDVLVLGSGGAGLMAALHAYDADPRLDVVVVAKGMVGKSGCTRLVQGGFNVALDPRDSPQLHFRDTLQGGAFLNDQDLAWTLVSEAPEIVRKLETKVGCFFDRREDGRIHQKPFAGQSFDRTVHRGDQTGIEIVSRLYEQLFARKIRLLDETRGGGGGGGPAPPARCGAPSRWCATARVSALPARCSCGRPTGRSCSPVPASSCSRQAADPACTRTPLRRSRRPGTATRWRTAPGAT